MLLHLDFSCDVPIYVQIRNQIVLGIAKGKLSAGEKLPTIRALSEECGINMMTVSKAYQLLRQEGFRSVRSYPDTCDILRVVEGQWCPNRQDDGEEDN